jgi:type II secretory pathway component PulM
LTENSATILSAAVYLSLHKPKEERMEQQQSSNASRTKFSALKRLLS